jgi:ATP-dependent Clp protease, protease subunit
MTTKKTDILEDIAGASEKIGIGLLNNHTHYLSGEINEETVGEVVKWLIYENLGSSQNKILTLYINSTGGDLYEAFALIDVMRNSKYTIRTVGIGAVMSAAFFIFASGTKGERYAGTNTSFMCHQFTESMDSKYHDLKATMRENDLCNARMIQILKDSTGLVPSKVKSKLLPASDVYLTADEVIELGVADHIL